MTRSRRRFRPRRTGACAAALAVALVLAGSTVADASKVNPGSLPQTSAEPGVGATLAAQMTVLWHAILRDDDAQARSVFFPEAAYITMKTGLLASPSGDFTNRLIGFYNLDLAAYHRLVETGGSPTLVRVEADAHDAAWIEPRECENLIGYWHLPGVRLVYRHGSRVYSVEVDSLISWRGVWYVVHLGPNPRPSYVGTVDGFQNGPGVPGPAGGC
jgi:hypothetical protein